MSDLDRFLADGFDNLDAFRAAESALAPYGFSDCTYRNDMSPCLWRNTIDGEGLTLFINWNDASKRESPDFPEFSAYDATNGESPSFDTLAGAVEWIKARVAPCQTA